MTALASQEQTALPLPLAHERIASLRSTAARPVHARKAIGKRRQRRHENGLSLRDDSSLDQHHHHDPHNLPMPLHEQRRLFPVPSPISRSTSISSTNPPTTDLCSANYGRFTLSPKGLSRAVRRAAVTGSRVSELVNIVESEILDWLRGNVYTDPDAVVSGRNSVLVDPTLVHVHPVTIKRNVPTLKTEETEFKPAIVELVRSPAALQWLITDNFERKICHFVFRLWDIVSFSKDDSEGRRITHILRPNIQKPLLNKGILPTPPTTDFDASSMSGSFLSDDGLSTSWEDGSEAESTFLVDDTIREESEVGDTTLERVRSIDEADIEDWEEDDLLQSVASLRVVGERTARSMTRSELVKGRSRSTSTDAGVISCSSDGL